jgi:hypothetical protein
MAGFSICYTPGPSLLQLHRRHVSLPYRRIHSHQSSSLRTTRRDFLLLENERKSGVESSSFIYPASDNSNRSSKTELSLSLSLSLPLYIYCRVSLYRVEANSSRQLFDSLMDWSVRSIVDEKRTPQNYESNKPFSLQLSTSISCLLLQIRQHNALYQPLYR